MHAIEIAERHHGAPRLGWQIGFMAKKTHRKWALETGARYLDGFAVRLKIVIETTS
jgi:hypothetical protein